MDIILDRRIKLAEAMGWEPTSSYTDVAGKVDVTRWRSPSGVMGQRAEDLPDPFTNPTDDYAVLEWMRADSRRMDFPRYVGALSDVMDKRLAASHAANYQVGDYARAALKVIDGS